MYNSNLIVKYLGIISEQEEMIRNLSKSNKTLVKRNQELKNRSELYKANALEWKSKSEAFKECLQETYNELIKDSRRCETTATKYAREQYELNS